MPVHVKVGGAWKLVDNIHVKVAGVWKQLDQAHIRIAGGTWKETLSVLSVIVAAVKLMLNSRFVNPCQCNVKVDNDGDLYKSTNVGGYGASYETWLDSGSNTQVWVQRTIISGSLNTDAGSGRLACTSDRIWGVTQTGDGLKQCTIDVKFYDAVSGGNLLDTQQVSMSASVESF